MNNGWNKKLTIWRNRDFVLLFSSYTVASFGKYFDMLAVMLMFSYVWQAEPGLISMIPVVYAIPHALFSQFAGVYIDKGQKIRLVLVADLLTALLTVMLIFISSPWVMLSVIFVRSCISIVHFPTQQALVKQMVHPELLLKAVTLSGTVNQLSKIIGPFLGASIAAAFSPRMSFFVYTVTLLISVCLLFFLLHVDRNELAVNNKQLIKEESFWNSWRSSWRVVFRSKVLLASFAFSLAAFLSIQLVDAQFVVLTRELLPDNPSVFGWLISAVGFGAVIILVILNRLTEIRRYGLFLGSAVFLIGVGLLGMGLLWKEPNVWILIMLALIIGLGTGIFSTVFSYILQMESADGTVAKLSGMYDSLTGIILVIAPLIGGLFVQVYGVFQIFQVLGGLTLIIGMTGIILQRVLWKPGAVKHIGRNEGSGVV